MRISARVACGFLAGSLAVALRAAPSSTLPEVHNFVLPAIESTLPVPSVAITPNPSFPNASYYAYGSVRAVGVGDFNGDGLPDIAYAPFAVILPGYTSIPRYPVQIWINKGGGRFEQQTTSIIAGTVPTTVNVLAVLVADFNNDGVDDVLFVDSGPDDGQCEDGTCTGERNTFLLSGADGKLHDATGTLPNNGKNFNHVSSLADVNGDGNMDVVLVRLGGETPGAPGLSFLLGDGKGGFSSSTRELPPDLGSGTYKPGRSVPGTATACDLDGDGRADLITGSYFGGTADTSAGPHWVGFYRQGPDGTFTESARVTVDPAWYAGGAFQIACGDIDGDGRNDVLVAWEVGGGPGGPLLQIWRNDGGFHFTDITLAARGTYDGSVMSRGHPVGLPAFQLVDFNGDGFLDIVLRGHDIGSDLVASTTTSFIWLNDGAGKFTPWHLQQNGAPVHPGLLELSLPAWGNYMALVMDANGDGRRDVVLIRQVGGDQPEANPQTKAVVISTLLRGSDVPTPNYQGLWWNPQESGWGINFAHQGDIIYATWFTYGLDGKPWWLVAAATRTADGVYSGKLYSGTGPAFSATPFDSSKVVPAEVGTATFTFNDSGNATFAYTVGGISQAKSITREQVGSSMPTCAWGVQPNPGFNPGLATNYQDMWWASPAGTESGWGINFTHHGDTIFATWFTFGLDGKPLWLVAGANKAAPNVYSGKLYTGTGPAFSTAPFDPAKVIPAEVGTATFTFHDGINATFAYVVNDVSQIKQITRQVFAPPGTVCH